MSRESSPGVIVRAENRHVGVLEAGDSYTATVTVTLPFELAGPMNVIAMADSALSESGYAQSPLSPRLSGVRGSLSGTVRALPGDGTKHHAQEVTLTPYAPTTLPATALTPPHRAVRGKT